MKLKAKRRYGVQPPADKCNKGNPSSYDACPQCGNGKSKAAPLCRNCRFRRPDITQPADPAIRIIALTRGKITTVDVVEHAALNRDRWSVTVKFNSAAGVKRWYAQRHDYATGNLVYMARQIMGFPKGDVDHINGDTLDNRRSNLRVTTRPNNTVNSGMRSNNTSGYKGVFWSKAASKWMASTKAAGKYRYLGLFEVKEDAARAYNIAAVKYFGEFARLNQL